MLAIALSFHRKNKRGSWHDRNFHFRHLGTSNVARVKVGGIRGDYLGYSHIQNLTTPSYRKVTLVEEGQTELQWSKQKLRTPAPFAC